MKQKSHISWPHLCFYFLTMIFLMMLLIVYWPVLSKLKINNMHTEPHQLKHEDLTNSYFLNCNQKVENEMKNQPIVCADPTLAANTGLANTSPMMAMMQRNCVTNEDKLILACAMSAFKQNKPFQFNVDFVGVDSVIVSYFVSKGDGRVVNFDRDSYDQGVTEIFNSKDYSKSFCNTFPDATTVNEQNFEQAISQCSGAGI